MGWRGREETEGRWEEEGLDGRRRDLERGRKDKPLKVVRETPQRWPRGLGAPERQETGENKRETGKEIGSPGKSREWERRGGRSSGDGGSGVDKGSNGCRPGAQRQERGREAEI